MMLAQSHHGPTTFPHKEVSYSVAAKRGSLFHMEYCISILLGKRKNASGMPTSSTDIS